ncbi:MAG: acyltransferase family protein [Terrimesophilobacter sp.]
MSPKTSTTRAPVGAAAPAKRFAGLDGLRALAVLVVILFHLTPGLLPGGYLGVDIFFVISGFLITALLLREYEKNGRIRLRDFWQRRARRLLPALALLLLIACAVALVASGNVLVGLGRQVLGATTFSSNWLSIAAERSYFTESNPELFRNLWSLAVEEQFYLLWPLVLLFLLVVRIRANKIGAGRIGRAVQIGFVGLLAAGSALAMALISLTASDPTRAYYGTDTHSFGLALGAVLALVSQNWPATAPAWPRWIRMSLQPLGMIAVGGLIAAAMLMPEDASWVYPYGLLAVSILAVVAIAASTMPGSVLGTALDVQPLRWVGERSYGLYLWHWPVFVLVVALLPTWGRDGASGWALGGIAFGVTVVASALSYHFIEQPIRRNGFRVSITAWFGGWRTSVPRLVSGIAASVLLVGLGVASGTAISRDPGSSDSQAIIEAGRAAISPPEQTATGKAPGQSVPSTALPSLPTGDRISAIGDSVMLAAAPALQAAFPGISIDAIVSRQLASAPDIIRGMMEDGSLRPIVVIGLGTNGPIEANVLTEIRSIVGTRHEIVVINVQAPRGWTPAVNSELSNFSQRYRNVEMANWYAAIAPYISTLAQDQVHPGPTGARIYVNAVRDALQRLAELPPVLTAKEYGLAPHPL